MPLCDAFSHYEHCSPPEKGQLAVNLTGQCQGCLGSATTPQHTKTGSGQCPTRQQLKTYRETHVPRSHSLATKEANDCKCVQPTLDICGGLETLVSQDMKTVVG